MLELTYVPTNQQVVDDLHKVGVHRAGRIGSVSVGAGRKVLCRLQDECMPLSLEVSLNCGMAQDAYHSATVNNNRLPGQVS
jgi:hypothetical protein